VTSPTKRPGRLPRLVAAAIVAMTMTVVFAALGGVGFAKTAISAAQYQYGKAHKTNLCHKPGTPAEHTINVAQAAVAAHMAHGDRAGTCAQVAAKAKKAKAEKAAKVKAAKVKAAKAKAAKAKAAKAKAQKAKAPKTSAPKTTSEKTKAAKGKGQAKGKAQAKGQAKKSGAAPTASNQDKGNNGNNGNGKGNGKGK
jgi:hypothetical protein